jgi:hypothetical protein
MPDFTQSPRNLEPPTVVDHVLVPVGDLEEGARWMLERTGLKAIPGGRHPNVGTANMIVPLGRQYLELIAIVVPKEAASSRFFRRVSSTSKGKLFVDWALRTRSVDSLRAKLLASGWDLPPIWEGSRRLPDGQVLHWRTQEVVTGVTPSALPFIIEWDVPEGLHPGEAVVEHPSEATTLRRVVVGTLKPEVVREQLRLLLGDSDLYEVREATSEGVEELVLESPHGDLVLK